MVVLVHFPVWPDRPATLWPRVHAPARDLLSLHRDPDCDQQHQGSSWSFPRLLLWASCRTLFHVKGLTWVITPEQPVWSRSERWRTRTHMDAGEPFWRRRSTASIKPISWYICAKSGCTWVSKHHRRLSQPKRSAWGSKAVLTAAFCWSGAARNGCFHAFLRKRGSKMWFCFKATASLEATTAYLHFLPAYLDSG